MKINKTLKTISYVVGIILMLVMIATLIGIVSGEINITNIKNFFGMDVPQIEYEPPEETSCLAYDIASKFRETYGTNIINSFEDACTDLGGEWREDDKELGCYWNPDLGTIDCDTDTTRNFEDYCEEGLLANWVCDNDIAYAGCLCKRAIPSDWEVPEDEQPVYTCGWINGLQCGGTCPDSHPTCEEIDWISGDIACACLDSMFIPHPDWKPGNQYYDPHIPEEPEPELFPIGTAFITNGRNTPSLGVSGFDGICQSEANAGGLPGTYKALVSTSSIDARDRIPDVTYRRMDGQIVAEGKSDLFDGSIRKSININADGNFEYGANQYQVLTGSLSDGRYSLLTCQDWTVGGYTAPGDADVTYGLFQSGGDLNGYFLDGDWLNSGFMYCGNSGYLYCFRVS